MLKQVSFTYENHFWNKPVLSNESKVSCSKKQRAFDGARPQLRITIQTRYPLRQAVPQTLK